MLTTANSSIASSLEPSPKTPTFHAFPDAKPSARSAASRVRNKAESLPGSDFLTYVETRKFYARVVRAQAAILPDDSDLWNVKKSSKGNIYLRFPDKLRTLALDIKLAGYDCPKTQDASSAEDDPITAMSTASAKTRKYPGKRLKRRFRPEPWPSIKIKEAI